MGEFTQNLLKLTEFPFSYSLMGLLALIFGKGVNPEELSFEKVGPLLILMGFVATTLSICDPIGAIQRSIIKGRKFPKFKSIGASTYFQNRIFGKGLFEIFPPTYLFAVAFSPSDIMRRYKIDWQAVENFSSEVTEFSRKMISREEFAKKRKLLFTPSESGWGILIIRIVFLPFTLLGVMTYHFGKGVARGFMEELNKDLGRTGRKNKQDKSTKGFQEFKGIFQNYGNELVKINEYDVQDIRELFEALKQQTVKTKWITAEVDRITALFYFIIIISLFIFAIKYVPDFLPKFEDPFGKIKSIDQYIIIFSIVALIGVCLMCAIRIIGLRAKALVVFKYLTALRAIKSREAFKNTFEDIERYLNDNHWTLAEYWVNRIQIDYSDLFLEEVKKPTSGPCGP